MWVLHLIFRQTNTGNKKVNKRFVWGTLPQRYVERRKINKLKMFASIFYAFFLVSGAVQSAQTDELEAKAAQLNMRAKELLGISIPAVRHLLDFDEFTSVPLSLIMDRGQLKYLKELEVLGYAVVKINNGLPDGSLQEQQFIQVIPTDKGNKLKRSLENLQPN
jgi:hypothetical protein